MSTVIRLANGDLRLYCKGASEIVVKQCTANVAADGTVCSVLLRRTRRLIREQDMVHDPRKAR